METAACTAVLAIKCVATETSQRAESDQVDANGDGKATPEEVGPPNVGLSKRPIKTLYI